MTNLIDIPFYYGSVATTLPIGAPRSHDGIFTPIPSSAQNNAESDQGKGDAFLTFPTHMNKRLPFKLPPSLLYGIPSLDDHAARWNKPECFYLRQRSETTYTLTSEHDGSDDGPPMGVLDDAHCDFSPWYEGFGLAHHTRAAAGGGAAVRCAVVDY